MHYNLFVLVKTLNKTDFSQSEENVPILPPPPLRYLKLLREWWREEIIKIPLSYHFIPAVFYILNLTMQTWFLMFGLKWLNKWFHHKILAEILILIQIYIQYFGPTKLFNFHTIMGLMECHKTYIYNLKISQTY